MKYVPSIAFDEMSGSAKGVTAAKNRGRKYIRNRGFGGSARTAAQSAVKTIFKSLSQSWRKLTNEQIRSWNQAALSHNGKRALGTSSKISGANLYSRLNFWVTKCGGAKLTYPPVLEGVEAPAEAEFDLSEGTFSMTLASVPSDTTNLKLVIMASAPQSNGISSAYGKTVQIGAPRAIVSTGIDIYGDYTDAFGEINDSKPKVFIKYFFVNAATGEKSGEILKLAILQSA